ncbi:unnamed protein product [Hapterophycus canaliculatus]
MRRNFEELRMFLHSHFPALAEARSVQGELYPPTAAAQALANLGSYAQMGGIAIALGGELIFDRLGVPQPFFVPVMRRNRMPTIVGLIVVNSVCSSFLATGAFEVFIDGELVFSRLESGKFPTGAIMKRELEERGMRSVRNF